jgi:hypothetical protein
MTGVLIVLWALVPRPPKKEEQMNLPELKATGDL